MKKQLSRFVGILVLVLFANQPLWATCGGGGGGGVGGMSGGGGGANAPVYTVPWRLRKPADAPAMGLILYWFPASDNELRNSSLRESRALSLYATQCVSMEYGTNATPNIQKLLGESKPPVAVLATPDGSLVNRIENKDGKLKVTDLEKLVEAEVKQRESALDAQMKDAGEKLKAGDKDSAIKIYRAV